MPRHSNVHSICIGMRNVLYYQTVTHRYLREYMSAPELTIERMLELAYGQAQNIIVGNKEQLMPIFMVLTGDDEIIFVGTPWDGDEQKDMAIHLLKDLMKRHNATAYSFLTEAWVSAQRRDDPDRTPPSQRADRREVVMAMATNGSDTKYRSWLIIRDMDGNCVDLVQEKEGIQISVSRFDGLLPTSPRPN